MMRPRPVPSSNAAEGKTDPSTLPSWQKKRAARGQPIRGTKFIDARLAGEGTMLHLYYTALFAVIVANVITVLFVIAIAINGRKRDN